MSSGERVSISGAHRGAGRVSCACFIKINRSNSTHACTRHTHALLRPRARLNERETAQPQPTRSRTPHPSHTSAPLESSGAPQPLTRLCVSTMAACALRAVTRAPVTRCRPREARQSVMCGCACCWPACCRARTFMLLAELQRPELLLVQAQALPLLASLARPRWPRAAASAVATSLRLRGQTPLARAPAAAA